jgi:hypothetical protein
MRKRTRTIKDKKKYHDAYSMAYRANRGPKSSAINLESLPLIGSRPYCSVFGCGCLLTLTESLTSPVCGGCRGRNQTHCPSGVVNYNIMESLKERLLASIEYHGKSDITGVYALYPHEKPLHILRALFTLRNEGWLIIRKTQTIDGDLYPRPNVRRSKKQMFTQNNLFDPSEG